MEKKEKAEQKCKCFGGSSMVEGKKFILYLRMLNFLLHHRHGDTLCAATMFNQI